MVNRNVKRVAKLDLFVQQLWICFYFVLSTVLEIRSARDFWLCQKAKKLSKTNESYQKDKGAKGSGTHWPKVKLFEHQKE